MNSPVSAFQVYECVVVSMSLLPKLFHLVPKGNYLRQGNLIEMGLLDQYSIGNICCSGEILKCDYWQEFWK